MTQARLELLADSRQIRTATKDLQNLERQGEITDRVVQSLGRAFALLGGAAVLKKTIGEIASFSQEMSTIRAISGATETQFSDLRKEIRLLGSTTRFSAQEAAQGAQFLARAGFSAEEAVKSLDGTLRLAQAGGLELAAAADIASNVLKGFRLEAEDTGKIVDILAFAANNSNTNVQQLGEGMAYVAPIAAGLGVSVEEASAAIGVLSDAGIQGSAAGTGLRRVLSSLEAPTGKSAQILKSLGLTTDDVAISQVGLTAALQRLKDAGIDTGQALELFGDRGGPAFEVLATGTDRVRELNAQLQDTEGYAKTVADVMDDNLNGALLGVRSAVGDLVIGLGDLGAESGATQTANSLADAVRSLTANLDTVVKVGGTVALVYGARMASAFADSRGAMIARTVASLELVQAEVTLARTAQARAVQEQLQAKRSLELAANATLRAGAITRLAAANQRVVGTNAALLASQNAVNASFTAGGIAARGLNAALTLIGGPAGVAALVAFGIYRISQSYRDGLKAQEDRIERIQEEHKRQKELNQSRGVGRQLLEGEMSEVEAQFGRYRSAVDNAFKESVSEASAEEFQAIFDETTSTLDRLTARHERMAAQFGEGNLRTMRAAEAVREYEARLRLLRQESGITSTTQEQVSESFQKVAKSIADQIYQLEKGEEAYDLMIAIRQAGVELGSAEAAQLEAEIKRRNELIEGIRAEGDARQAATAAQRAVEGGLGLSQEGRINIQLQNELNLLEAYYADKEGMEAEHQERRLQLIQDAEERIASLNGQTLEAFNEGLELVNWDSFSARAAGSFATVALGAQDGTEAMRALGQSILMEGIGNIVQYGIKAAAAWAMDAAGFAAATTIKTKAATAATAVNTKVGVGSAGTLATAYAPAAAAASVATAGGAPAAGASIGLPAIAALIAAFSVGAIAGKRRQGGNVYAGQTYEVNEQGMELFTPSVNGRITPAHQVGGGGGNKTVNVNVDFTVNAMDTIGFDDWINNNRDTITNAVTDSLRMQGVEI